MSARGDLWESLGIDPDRISREEFDDFLDVYDHGVAEKIRTEADKPRKVAAQPFERARQDLITYLGTGGVRDGVRPEGLVDELLRLAPGCVPGPVREGSVWIWQPLKPDAREEVRITETRWNGEEWCIQTEILTRSRHSRVGQRSWNELSRFVEAAVLLRPAPEER